MKLFPVNSIVWPSLLFLWASRGDTEDNNPDVCQGERGMEELHILTSLGKEEIVDKTENENFSCLLYPTNSLNCSWSFPTLHSDAQLSVHISVCDKETVVQSWNSSSKKRNGSQSLILRENLTLPVVLQFNTSLHSNWTFYTYDYDMDLLEVLSPPSNISASVKGEDLRVTWGLPGSRSYISPPCFEYQLDLGDQGRPKTLTDKLSYTELNDPTRTYSVKIRAKKHKHCIESPQWSDWSPTVTVKQSGYKLNVLVIISISLGIPMILLAVLLLVRHQRVFKHLFPPIPRPPPKYIHFLEKNDPSSFFHLAQSTKVEEEITEVDDTGENTGKTL